MKRFIHVILESWLANDNTGRAAAIAFYTLFSFPSLIFLSINLATLIFNKDTVQKVILETMHSSVNPEIITVIEDIFTSSSDFHWTNSVISFVIVFYASAKIFTELRTAFNRIYGVEISNKKDKLINFIEGKIISLILVSATCLLSLLTLTINFVLNKLEIAQQRSFNMILLHSLNNLVSVLLLGGIFLGLYKFLPSRKITWTAALAGTIVGVILFEVGKYLIALYLSMSLIAGFYGSLGSLVMLMLWVYYTAQILLLGAEFAIGIDRRFNQAS